VLIFWSIFKWFRRVLYVLVLAAFVYLVVTSGQVIAASRHVSALPNLPGTPVVVVIGSATGSTISTDLKQRCVVAQAIYHLHKGAKVIVTGASSSNGAPSEASVAASCLGKLGVRHVVEVPAGEITAQLSAVSRMLTPAQRQNIVLVIDPLQAKWVQSVAAADNMHAQAAGVAVARQSYWHDVKTIWGQALAVGYGRIFGYNASGWLGG
jgi:hypothetical protein